MSFNGQNIIVLDCETLHSAADVPTGWSDKAALGLSIGCYFDYQDGHVHWFDQHTLVATMLQLLERQPMIVSFNGVSFDSLLMACCVPPDAAAIGMFQRWQPLWEQSYDLLAEIWAVDPENKYVKGLNSLDALLAANSLPPKTGTGELAPRLWQEGRIADVLNYCQNDVLQTKALLELVARQKGTLQRRTGPVRIRHLCARRTDQPPRIVMECLEGAP